MKAFNVTAAARKLLLALVLSGVLSLAYIVTRVPQVRLTMELAASQPYTAQLFYDVGSGYNQADSFAVKGSPNSAASFHELTFNLPAKPIFHLRFDPSTTETDAVIRNIAIRSGNAVFYRIEPSAVQPSNRMTSVTPGANGLRISALDRSTGPSVTFVLTGMPLRPYLSLKGRNWRLLPQIAAGLVLAVLLILSLKRPAAATWRWMFARLSKWDKLFQAVAKSLSSPAFIEFDSFAIWVYMGCVSLFLIGGALDLNGSSSGMYSAYKHGARVKTWIGSPRGKRSDEWGYVTPDILNQYFRADRFAVRNSVLGNHSIALTGNIPVKHVSTVFRPQFWSFFIFPLDYAYAFYWQAKGLLLLTGVFTFLLWITRSSAWALTGALWYFWAPFTQWSYSWPSALPEMIGLICLACVFFAYLAVGRRSLALFLCALGAAACSLNFILCAYPPHMIPLFWVAAATWIAWLIAARKDIFVRERLFARLVACALAIGLVALVGWRVYADLKPAIQAVANTVYPGQRVVGGGTMSVWQLASHFLPWTETENRFPAALGNISEGSGFLWLAPITLLCLPRLALGRFQKAALFALWACFVLILCWLIFPLPVAFGRMFALNLTFGARCLPALGLANIGIVAVSVAGLIRNLGSRRLLPISARDAIYFSAALLLCAAIFSAANWHIAQFFSTAEILFAAVVAAALMVLMLTRRQAAFAVALLVPQLLIFGAVNPVERGLPVFAQSDLRRFVKTHPELLHGKWIMFSDAAPSSGFLAATGCDVYTGTRYLPDIDRFSLFASRGLDLNTFNRLGYLDAGAVSPDQPTEFRLETPVVVKWNVSPADPILPQIGIRYVAFDKKPSSDVLAGLAPVSAEPVDGFWLYQIPAGAPR